MTKRRRGATLLVLIPVATLAMVATTNCTSTNHPNAILSTSVSTPMSTPSPTATAVQQPVAALTGTPSAPAEPSADPTHTPSPAGPAEDAAAGHSQDAPPIYSFRVITAYSHDAAAFTQGLVFTDGMLYESTGLYGRSSLRRVDLPTGQVLQSRALASTYFGEGMTILDDRIVQLTWQSHTGFVYDKATFDTTPPQTFTYATEGWGLTHDGTYLVMSDGSSYLRFLDPITYGVMGQVQVHDHQGPVVRINELEFVDGDIFANIWMKDRIARIDPASGRVLAWVDLADLLRPRPSDPNAVLNGIAYDREGERLFVTGKLWPSLFQVEFLAPGMPPAQPWRQVDPDGLGKAPGTGLTALGALSDTLFAGTRSSDGAQLWRSTNGLTWTAIVSDGFGSPADSAVSAMASFHGALYAGIESDAGAAIWRSGDGFTFTQVLSPTATGTDTLAIMDLAVYSDTLYAGTRNESMAAQLWRSQDGAAWEPMGAIGAAANAAVSSLAVYSQALYVGTENPVTGAEIWRYNGVDWRQVVSAGLSAPRNVSVTSLRPFSGALYALTENSAGCQVWRATDGLQWQAVVTGGFDAPANHGGGGLQTLDGVLFSVVGNSLSGVEVWRSQDGLVWRPASYAGWDDHQNVAVNGDNALLVDNRRLLAGTVNANGGQLWVLLANQVFVPLADGSPAAD